MHLRPCVCQCYMFSVHVLGLLTDVGPPCADLPVDPMVGLGQWARWGLARLRERNLGVPAGWWEAPPMASPRPGGAGQVTQCKASVSQAVEPQSQLHSGLWPSHHHTLPRLPLLTRRPPPAVPYLWLPPRPCWAPPLHCAVAAGPAAGGGRGPAPGHGLRATAQLQALLRPCGPAAGQRAVPGSTHRSQAAGPTAGSYRPAWRQARGAGFPRPRRGSHLQPALSSLSCPGRPCPKVPSPLASPRTSLGSDARPAELSSGRGHLG